MRLLRGIGALLTLLVGLVGIPAALLALAGNPLPGQLSWATLVRTLLRPDDGSVVIGLIAVIGWVAWLVFAVSLVVELVNVVAGHRFRVRLPGLGGPQRVVAGLLLAVIALIAVPSQGSLGVPAASAPAVAHPLPGSSPTVAAPAAFTGAGTAQTAAQAIRSGPVNVGPAGGGAGERSAPSPAPQRPYVTHVVERGDDLWSLASHYYGQGRDWRKIADANPHVLTGGPDRLLVGWKLRIPDVTPSTPPRTDGSVVVRSGDSLSSIAQRLYGDASRWPDLFEANRSELDDPDEIEVGTRLRLPGPRSDPRPAKTKADVPEEEQQATRSGSAQDDQRADHDGPVPDASSPPPVAPTTRPSGAASSPTPTRSAAPADRSTAGTAADGSQATPSSDATGEPVPVTDASAGSSGSEIGVGLLGVGGLLAAGVLGGLSWRRRVQLQTRPLGRRIAQPPVRAQRLEAALGQAQRPLDLETLDLAARAIAAHCLDAGVPLPRLTLATVSPEIIELSMTETVTDAPVGFRVSRDRWTLDRADAGYLASIPGVDAAPRPYPALVSLGVDESDRQVLVDLEAIGQLGLEGGDPDTVEALLTAIAVELSFCPWADEMILTLVGSAVGLSAALDKHNVTETDQVDELLDRLEHRASVQRSQAQHQGSGQNRVDPDLADPWAPEILLVGQSLTEEQQRRLSAVTTGEPRVTMAAVLAVPAAADGDDPSTPPHAPAWRLVLGESQLGEGSPGAAVLQPLGLRLRPQGLTGPAAEAVVDLVAATGSDQTSPAPWWDHGGDPPAPTPPDNVMYLGRRFGGWGSVPGEQTGPEETRAAQASAEQGNSQRGEGMGTVAQEHEGTGGTAVHHPTLRLLGPVELVGVTGPVPPRAAKQCLEYCGWLLEHPGTTALAMASALIVAEGTRRSNMSRLRAWLGLDPTGDPYLPDAYTGRIVLHPSVSSDWQRLQILTAAGINRTSTQGLQAALQLVRGAPLADAAPGQWHWAEELRTDMISAVRDLGVELTSRALADQDTDLARWAAARALAAAPGDELLLALRIRTEHLAGNVVETERLTLQLAAQARTLGVDLEAETVTLLQEVMEGRVRARLA